jgi:4-hydroxy-tetrahydrodipicolinate synthase
MRAYRRPWEDAVLDLEGLIPATVLPMTEDGDAAPDVLKRYVRWVAGQGPVALAVNADTGEGPQLTRTERRRVLDVVREAVDIPIIAGLGGPSTRSAVEEAEDYRAAGADAVLVFPVPAFQGDHLDPRVPLEYHRAIAEVGLPLVVFQLQPALGGVLYERETLAQLLAVDGVVAVKEASFDRARCREVIALAGSLPRPVTVLTGNDNFILESLELGCDGALVGFGTVMVAEQVAMIRAWRAGQMDEARSLGKRVQRLADAVFADPVGSYRARLKECLALVGVLDGAHVRPPLLPVPPRERASLERVLSEVGLLETQVRA